KHHFSKNGQVFFHIFWVVTLIMQSRERFYRSANVRGTVPGTGLGLAIANQLATINNGRIKLRDNQPHGTIAELILPLATTKERHQLNES
ncbi:ATP-binding protein, partial [Lacticaseibacillus paracasei]|uniref:ATP-binding protein n=1 Tax=Lacticaseibacillus paracasei TaxID=1597 RepID=UPI001CDBC59B